MKLTKNGAKKAAINTGKGLGFFVCAIAAASVANAEEQERQRKIQEHTDALKALSPDCDLIFVRKA